MQLGTSSNTSADYCLVYNYYAGVSNPASCVSNPTQSSTGNNGNVAGFWYQDNVNTTYNHIAAYGYDHVNRLTSAVATGNSTYNLTFSYTADGSNGQYGDMTCVVNGQTNGLCPQYTFNAANNQITGYSYDAAGNLTNDGTYSYQWDAEGRLSQSLQSGTVLHTYTYNALGRLAEDVATAFHTLEYAYDPSGQLLGHFMAYPPQPAWWHIIVPVLGRTAFVDTENWFVGAAWIDHYDALGSALAATDQTGAVVQTEVYYPWGQGWLGTGTGIFAGLVGLQCWGDNPCPVQSQTRDYPLGVGQWMSPDPAGQDAADPSDPQTWNMYAYAGNNPTTNTDPTGELYCGPADENGTMPCVLDQEYFNNPDQYQGYTYYQSDYPQEQNEPNGQQEAGAQSPDLDPIDLGLLAYGGVSLVRGIADVGPDLVRIVRGAFTSETPVIQTLPIGRFVTGQGIKTVVQTAQGPLEITAQVETQGSKIILKNLSVSHPEGIGVKTNPGVGALKATIDALKSQLAQDGFTQLEYRALNWTRPPVGFVSGTFNLK